MTSPSLRFAALVRACRRNSFSRGKKPWKKNCFKVNGQHAKAEDSELGPGTVLTEADSSKAAFSSSAPGSEKVGQPWSLM